MNCHRKSGQVGGRKTGSEVPHDFGHIWNRMHSRSIPEIGCIRADKMRIRADSIRLRDIRSFICEAERAKALAAP